MAAGEFRGTAPSIDVLAQRMGCGADSRRLRLVDAVLVGDHRDRLR